MKNSNNTFNRRSFLKISSAAGGGLVLGFNFFGCAPQTGEELTAVSHLINAYLQINTDGKVIIQSPNPEVGQGIKTAMPMIVAEELDIDWKDVLVEQAPLDSENYKRQVAGGSGSIRTTWKPLREAGANVRQMLVNAAAQKWEVNANECTTEQGFIIHKASGKKAGYGEFAEAAAQMEVPKEVTLKKPSEFNLLGKAIKGVDNKDIFTGKPLYGLDFKREGMLYATIVHPPAFGQTLKSVDEEKVKAMPGIEGVYTFSNKVAIVARSSWEALKGKKAISIEWENPANLESTEEHRSTLSLLLDKAPDKPRRKDGKPEKAFASAVKVIEREYECPFLSHSPMEPMNFFAHVQADKAKLIGPTQTPARARKTVADLFEIDQQNITVEMTRMGGGFGRRLRSDFVEEAAQVSKLANAPIQLIWTREDDMTAGIYRPSCKYRFRAALDSAGKLTGFHVRAAGINARNATKEHNFPASAVENYLAESHNHESKVTTGPWRAPIHNFLAFAEQSFLDEVAIETGQDPVQFRLDLLEQAKNNPVGELKYDPDRFIGVIKLAAEKANWGQPKEGVFQGFSAYFSHLSYVAQVAEVVMENDKPKVKKVICAVDCGILVNKSGAENQIEGGIIDGIGHAMFGRLTLKDGRPEQTNFDTYRLIRINEVPEIESHFVQNEIDPTGLGEPTLPPVPAALSNAIYAATGKRLYNQPFIDSGLLG